MIPFASLDNLLVVFSSEMTEWLERKEVSKFHKQKSDGFLCASTEAYANMIKKMRLINKHFELQFSLSLFCRSAFQILFQTHYMRFCCLEILLDPRIWNSLFHKMLIIF
mmetsp:Transcript_15917/g.20771  ORF Transcript_15917/g.20771 Transcript_15917/m.20771 type:complete len:109 (-) Transcript_15917:178-504(-)